MLNYVVVSLRFSWSMMTLCFIFMFWASFMLAAGARVYELSNGSAVISVLQQGDLVCVMTLHLIYLFGTGVQASFMLKVLKVSTLV